MSTSVAAAARFAPAAVARSAFRSSAAARRSFLQHNNSHPKAASRRFLSNSSSLLAKKYSEEHEWIELGADGKTGTIGITTYAAQQLGDVVYVELPELDSEISKGDVIGAVESVKSASDILSPVSGKIVERNESLEEKPSSINADPEGQAWLAKIEIADPAELDTLLDPDAYIKYTEEADH
ncbi:hypothetical protein DV738_g4765, partial [Chaetothyriales sp. CBS 135597]